MPIALTAAVVLVMGPVTGAAGESLLAKIGPNELAQRHAELGDLAEAACIATAIAAAILLLAHESRLVPAAILTRTTWLTGTTVRRVLDIVVGIGALAALVTVVLAGHSGAVAAWQELMR